MYKQKGMALVIVLIFLNILVLFSVYAMQNNQWQYKMAAAYWQRHKLLLEAGQVLRQVEAQVKAQIKTSPQNNIPNCVIPLATMSELSSAPLAWWQSGVSCVGNSPLIHYYYVIEMMAEEPCVGLSSSRGIEVPKFIRLSLLAISVSGKQAKILLQSSIAMPGVTKSSCYGAFSLGRQAWREIKS